MRPERKIILVLFFLLCTMMSFGQSGRGLIANQIEKAEISALADQFTENIDLSILEVDAVYSKTQAEMVLKRFFRDNTPSEFVIEHQGSAAGDSRYVIGRLTTEKGDYRITYFLKSVDGKSLIKQFRIENY